MSITYEHKYDVTYIYNKFKKNRVNAVSYLGTSNNEKLEPDSSAYLSYENLYVNNYTYTYIYARKSSPTIDSDIDKNYAYLKVGDTTYNFYHGHAYTYTETVTGNGVKPILIAYDFVNQISTQLEFKDVSISHNAAPISDIPQTVNVFSPVSYIIENGEKSLKPKNEYSISKDEINTLLNGKTFADFTTYVTYSYLNSEKGDGIVYEDGKDTLSTNPINDIHVWSLSDGVSMRTHAYVNHDTTAVNPTVKLNVGQKLKDAITHDANFSTHFSYRYNYDTNYVESDINYTSNNTYYIQMGNQTFENFYKNSYAYYKGNYTNNTFGYCYTWPATRWNKQSYDFYETVYVKSKFNVSDYDSNENNENNDNNVNTACYISSISKLPVGLLYCNSNEGTYIPITSYVYGGKYLNKAPDGPNGIDHYTVEFSYKMINSNGTLSNDTYTLTVKSSYIPQSFQYDGTKHLYPDDTTSFYIDSPYFKMPQSEESTNIPDNTYGKVLYWSTKLYCPSNFLDNKIVTGLNIKAWTYGSYLSLNSPGLNTPLLDVPCVYKTSTSKGLNYKYSRGSASHLEDEYKHGSDKSTYAYYGCEITPLDPLNVRIESINIKFYIKSNI